MQQPQFWRQEMIPYDSKPIESSLWGMEKKKFMIFLDFSEC